MAKKKRKLKKSVKISFSIFSFIVCVLLVLIIGYQYNLSAVDKNGKKVEITIEAGDSYSSLGSFLKEQKLIRSTLSYKIYIKTHELKRLEPGTYMLSQSMNVKEILQALESRKQVIEVITFREGLNMRQVASLVHEKLDISENEFLEVASNQNNLNEWIKKYWFLTDDIKNPKIYYPLEGYLFPDTYQVEVGRSAKELIEKMLNNTEAKLEPLKSVFKTSSYSIHEIMTIASMAELEAVSESDREQVARVFYNRLDYKMSLGSDVTTYYGAKVTMGERDLYQSEINEANDYNTRHAKMAGKLPVSPICNPSIEAIKVSINPKDNDYFYFVADKNRKVYFNTNDRGHQQTIASLKKQGLWLSW